MCTMSLCHVGGCSRSPRAHEVINEDKLRVPIATSSAEGQCYTMAQQHTYQQCSQTTYTNMWSTYLVLSKIGGLGPE